MIMSPETRPLQARRRCGGDCELGAELNLIKMIIIISSVRSSSVYHGLLHTYIHTYIPTIFSDFSDSSDMCYIFEKHWIQGYQI